MAPSSAASRSPPEPDGRQRKPVLSPVSRNCVSTRHKLSPNLDTGVTAVYGHVTKRRLAGASPLQRRSATVTVTTATPILEARGLRRSFGAVRALDEADFDVYAGEVVALIGDNGAGKSTMVKRCRATSHSTLARRSTGTRSTSTPAGSIGIETVFQELALASHPNPAQNMFRGRETPASGLFRVHGHQGHAGPIEGGIRRPWPRPSAATAIRGRHRRWPAPGDRRRPCRRLSQGGPARRAHRGARVSDRVQVLRLGCRVATYDTK
jgi:ABC transporter